MYKVQPSPQCERPHDETSCALGHARRDFGLAASAKQKKLDPLDEAGGLLGAGVQVQRGVVVAHTEGDLDTFGIDEILALGVARSS